MRVLILGGTSEARAAADLLVRSGHEVTSSLAGRVARPRLPVGAVRVGGFGGPEGLAEWVERHEVDVLIDATHPYAVGMSANAGAAAARTSTPLVHLARPGWQSHPDAENWTWVDGYEDARAAADQVGSHPFITTGRQTLRHYRPAWDARSALVRVVEPLDDDAPAAWTVVRDRGPYEVAAERALMHAHGIDVLLTKDSGGSYTSAKLTAARGLGVHVVVVRRPALVAAHASVTTAAAAVALAETLSRS